MATKLVLVLIFIPFSFFFSQALPHNHPPGNIHWWCRTTPHPEPCNYFMGHNHHHHFKPKHLGDFRTMTVQVAMDRALQAHEGAEQLGQKCRSKRKKAAWKDCIKLFNNTIFQLNHTLMGLRSNFSCSNFDAQTWLSAALTNLQICRAGSLELNVTNFISPILSNNVSELISNSLAINGVLMEDPDYNDGYPSWVNGGERKLLEAAAAAEMADAVVAKDGSGKFGSVQAAVNYAAAVRRGSGRFVIYVKRGVYSENVEIGIGLNKIMLVGEGLGYTIITGSRSVAGGFTTYSSATFGVDGIGFMARDITFRNTAGPQYGQAVALRSASDLSVFYNCGFQGYQDTLFVLAQRQFFKACNIYGTIDFIFGNAAVVFQNCNIFVRKPLIGQINVITAQGRADPYQNTAISIHNSRVVAAPDLRPVVNSFETYLGRPWQLYSRTVFLNTYLGSLVNSTGWLPWEDSNFGLSTLYYGEYKNFGPAASTRNRVKWSGYHVIRSSKEASRFTVANLLAGQAWLPSTGVPFTVGL